MKTLAQNSSILTGSALATRSWWNCVVPDADCVLACQPKGAASEAASYTNLVPGSTLTLAGRSGAAPSWTSAGGWENSTSVEKEILFGFPRPNLGKTHTVIARLIPATQTSQWNYGGVIGTRIPNNIVPIAIGGLNSTNFGYGLTTAGVSYTRSSMVGVDLVVASARKNYDVKLYIDGSNVPLDVGGTLPDPNSIDYTMYSMFVRDPGPGSETYYRGKILAIAVYQGQLLPEQISIISAKMAAL
jgi:hypothetical protein